MKYFIIAGEASGDLHASHLMKALAQSDSQAEFHFYGGSRMEEVGGTMLCHYRELAYMGFIQVALHLRTILRHMRKCRRQIEEWKPDALILVDYPGFNLKMAEFARKQGLCPVFYYISPKIWAWKEHRIKQIRRNVDRLFSILPFEVDFFEKKHHYPISYVGNPTVDEIYAYQQTYGLPRPDGKTLALLPGSRRNEISDNLSRMLEAAESFSDYQLVIAQAPAIESEFYQSIISESSCSPERISLQKGDTFGLLSHSTAALVTSGTATLETALLRVPQIVCYYMRCGWVVSRLRPYFLKVPFISLVNLITGKEVVPELVADVMNPANIRKHLQTILPGGSKREEMLRGYTEMADKLGQAGAPERAAHEIVAWLKKH